MKIWVYSAKQVDNRMSTTQQVDIFALVLCWLQILSHAHEGKSRKCYTEPCQGLNSCHDTNFLSFLTIVNISYDNDMYYICNLAVISNASQ